MIVKFCGMRRREDILEANILKPDMVGFILDPSRKRYVSPETIRELRKDLDPGIKVVGVFVDEDISVIRSLVEDGTIDIVQLHGHETDEMIRKIKESTGAVVIRAYGIRSAEDIEAAEQSPADLVTVDAPGGGTGSKFDWELLKQIRRPYIMAGGLNTDNIGEAVSILAPYGVDVSSGIETDGVKDKNKMEAFMALARKG